MHKITKTWVKQNAEQAGRILCEALGMEVKETETCLAPNSWCYNFHLESLDIIHKYLEKAVIEKVGRYEWIRPLAQICGAYKFQSSNAKMSVVATASASERLTACLLAMGITEVSE